MKKWNYIRYVFTGSPFFSFVRFLFLSYVPLAVFALLLSADNTLTAMIVNRARHAAAAAAAVWARCVSLAHMHATNVLTSYMVLDTWLTQLKMPKEKYHNKRARAAGKKTRSHVWCGDAFITTKLTLLVARVFTFITIHATVVISLRGSPFLHSSFERVASSEVNHLNDAFHMHHRLSRSVPWHFDFCRTFSIAREDRSVQCTQTWRSFRRCVHLWLTPQPDGRTFTFIQWIPMRKGK